VFASVAGATASAFLPNRNHRGGYMIRLERGDFDDPVRLEKLAAIVKMTPEQFTERFGYVVR